MREKAHSKPPVETEGTQIGVGKRIAAGVPAIVKSPEHTMKGPNPLRGVRALSDATIVSTRYIDNHRYNR